MAGLTSAGYTPGTAGEWLERAKTLFTSACTALNLTPPRYDRAEFVTITLSVLAQIVSEIDNAVAAIFDQHDPNQASGVVLRNLARLASVTVDEGARSTVVLTLGVWSRGSVLFTEGAVRASDGTNTWVLAEDVTVAASSTGTAVFEAEESGFITADAGTIVQRVTNVPGWVSVTNAADAVPGRDAEDAASIRARIGQGQGSSGSGSELAIQSAIEAVPGVQYARVIYNKTFTATTVSGRSIPSNGVGVWVYPDTLTAESRSQIFSVLFAKLGGNVNRSLPTTTGSSGAVASITASNGQPHSEGFWYMTGIPFKVRVQILLFEGTGTLASTQGPVRTAVANYFARLGPGDAVVQQDIIGVCVGVTGVRRVAVTINPNGAGHSDADVEVSPSNFARLDNTVPDPVQVFV